MTKTINFNDLSRGTVVDNEYTSQGVTISAFGGSGKAMIFDTSRPTGNDHDLATNNLGNVLIISEDGDSHDPDDNAHGGVLRFNFHEGADVKSLTFLDVEESAVVKFYNAHGQLIATRQVSPTANNGQKTVHFNVEGAYYMDVHLNGSGAVDNLVFDDLTELDGIVEGTSGNDRIDANYTGDPDGDRVDNNDAILGDDAPNDDRIYAFGGDDVVLAGVGDDSVFGGTGNDKLFGEAGNDYLNGGSGNDLIKGGDGNDFIAGGAGDDYIEGNDGNDAVEAAGGNDKIFGGAGNDDLWASSGNDTVFGGTGNDIVDGGAGHDILKGGDGNDVVSGGSGDDVIDGGEGDDKLFGDRIRPDKGDSGVAGNDKIYGGAGDDHIDGGDGDDLLAGGSGNDTILGGEGDDKVEASSGEDVVFGGAGDDDLWASSGNDTVFGGLGHDSIDGGSGNDILKGQEGHDEISGGSGDDRVEGGDGADKLYGDRIRADKGDGGAPGNDVIFGGNGNDFIDGGAGDDMLFGGSGSDSIVGGDGNDKIEASSGDDVIDGGAGDDDIWGGRGNDVITTGDGADTVNAGEGADTIFGSAGDTIEGGSTGDDNDVLDLTGQGPFFLAGPDGTGAPVADSNGNGIDGTVIFVDGDGNPTGETISFTEIEAVVGNEVNRGPDAQSDDLSAGEDDPAGVIGNVLDNDSDPDGDPLTVGEVNGDPAGVGNPVPGSDGGLVTINPDGTVTFDPNGDFESLGDGETAETTVTYTVTDPDGATSTETVTITVTGTNDAPTAVADTDSTDQDTAIVLDNVLGNDTDPEDDQLTVSVVNGEPASVGTPVPADNGGLVTINVDGSATFDPNGDFDDLGDGETAETSVTYEIVDGNGGTDITTVTITVTGSNDGPTAVADTGTTDEDTPTDLANVLGNDTDPDGDDLTVGAVDGAPANVGQPVAGDNGGLVTINPDGSASFDPNGDFEGLDDGETAETTVTYTVVDENGAEDTATVTITVTGVNDAPNAVDSAYVVAQDEAAGDVDANAITDNTGEGVDSDPEDDPLTVVAVAGDDDNVGAPVVGDNGGLFTINADGTVDFDANGEFDDLGDGETASTTVTYTIADDSGATDTATVTFTVTGSNDGPVAVADDLTAGEDDPAGVVGNVLDNDSDPDGDPLTVGAVNGDPSGVGAPVPGSDGGLVTINPDGTVTFDPNGEFDDLGEGETAETTVTYTVVDPDGSEATETVTITVTGTNDAPTAVTDTDSTDQDTAIDLDNVLGNDSDPENDPLTVSEVNGDPAGVGTPIEGDNGGLITINEDGTASFDPNGDFDDLGDGDTAETTVTYTITDPDGGTDTTTVTVTVTGGNDGPTAVADTFEGDEDTPEVVGNVLDNDEDPDGDPLTVGAVNGDPANVGQPVPADGGGLVTINEDGTVTFDPNGEFDELAPGETAEVTIEYTVTDPAGAESTETVTITVNGINDGPEATDNAYTFDPTEGAGDVDGNVITDDTGNGVDSDPENDNLTVSAVGGAAAGVGAAVVGDNGGLFTISEDGTVDFDANGEFDDLGLGETAETSVTYTIVDENGAEDTATVTFTVNGVNDGTVQGTNGDDVIIPGFVDADGDIVDAGDNILPGKEPNDDVILAGPGNDSVLAGLGDDTVFGGLGDDNIDGGEGDDLLLGGDGDDTVAGGDGDDRIFGAEGDDDLSGGDGDDVLEGSEGNDTLDGGAGDDDVWGGLDDDVVSGGAGNDTVAGEDGNDTLFGGVGDDVLDGGAGNDVITDDDGNDTVDGGDGDDVINVGNTQGDEAPDVGYPEQPSATIPGLTFPGYDADDDPNDDKDFVDGGAGNDVINTGDDDDSIIGGTGDDTINAGFDDDTIDGGAGNDLIEGSEGNDVIEGGDGDDLIFGGLADPLADLVSFPDDEPNEFGFQDLVPENNGDTIFGGAGNDTIFGQDDDDTLFGGSGDDVLDGGVDDDELVGGDGDDTLLGGQGNDDLEGGAGDDVLEGGDGEDFASGGLGSDTFVGGNGGDVVVGGEDPDDGDIDVLDLTGSNVDFITYVDGDPEAGTVTFLDGSTMTFSEIENVIPCFTPGTTIATPKGERLVEELKEGDRIITRDNGIQEIAWVGHKTMDGKQLAANPHLKPILIKAGSLGDGLPERDMLVSPNHRVLVASEMTQLYFEEREVLAAAKHMTGAQGIHAVDVMATTYIHFMFEKHEVVLSNGAWTESFQPGDYSLKGIGNSQRNEIFELFPELATKGGLEDYQSARKALKKHEAKLLMK